MIDAVATGGDATTGRPKTDCAGGALGVPKVDCNEVAATGGKTEVPNADCVPKTFGEETSPANAPAATGAGFGRLGKADEGAGKAGGVWLKVTLGLRGTGAVG